MPYINKQRRMLIKPHFGAYNMNEARRAGELNYQLSTVIERYRKDHGDNYQTFNDIIGALEAQKLEFYRRVVVPYETQKQEANGDVYENPTSQAT